MKFGTVWKYYFTESLLKATIRTPSQFHLAPNALRPLLDQLCRLFPQNPTVQIRPL
ncbi:esterase, partial [Acinetobacter baumannii]|nr:esterase [Acinetobacter baumannii]